MKLGTEGGWHTGTVWERGGEYVSPTHRLGTNEPDEDRGGHWEEHWPLTDEGVRRRKRRKRRRWYG